MKSESESTLPRTAQEIHETLADGKEVLVSFQDPNTQPEILKVRRIPRRDFIKYLNAVGRSFNQENDETAEAAYYLDRPVEFVETLTEESLDDVLQEGRRLNFSRLKFWLGRRLETMNMIGLTKPEVKAAVEEIDRLKSSRNSMSS